MTMVFPVARAGPTFHAHMRTFFWEDNNEKKLFDVSLIGGLTGEVPCVITSDETKITNMVHTKTHME